MKRKLLACVLLIVVFFSLCPSALAVVGPTDAFYVADYAGVLSDALEKDIVSLNGSLEHYCSGAQVVVVFVKYLDGMYADEYAVQLFNTWEIASNGMLLLFSPLEGRGGIVVGNDIENSFTVSDRNEYLDSYFWEDFDAGHYDDAVVSLVSHIAYWYEEQYNVSFFSDSSVSSRNVILDNRKSNEYPDDEYDDGGYYYDPYYTGSYISSRLFTIMVIAVIFLVFYINDRRRYRAYYLGLGMPIPPYHIWYLLGGPHHRFWTNGPRGPRGPGGPGSFGGFGGTGGSSGGFGGFGSGNFGGGFSGRGFGGGGFSGGGFGGRR